jgi:DnaJ-class molecular chaperone
LTNLSLFNNNLDMKMTLQKALSLFQFASIDAVSTDIIKKRYLDLAQKKHPDKGGSTQEFIELKDAYAYLRKFATDAAESVSSNYTNYTNSTSNRGGSNDPYSSGFTNKEYVSNLESVNEELNQKLEFYKRELDKAEGIIRKGNDYNKSVLLTYESIFNKELDIFNRVEIKVNKIKMDYDASSEQNRNNRDSNLKDLKRQYSPAFKDLINPFQRKIANDEFMWRQNSIIQEYEDAKQKIDSNYHEARVDLFQGFFEKISDLLKKNS